MPSKKSILLRISPELWEQLSRWAGDELRSVNGQIEFILREAVRERTGRSIPPTGDDTDSREASSAS